MFGINLYHNRTHGHAHSVATSTWSYKSNHNRIQSSKSFLISVHTTAWWNMLDMLNQRRVPHGSDEPFQSSSPNNMQLLCIWHELPQQPGIGERHVAAKGREFCKHVRVLGKERDSGYVHDHFEPAQIRERQDNSPKVHKSTDRTVTDRETRHRRITAGPIDVFRQGPGQLQMHDGWVPRLRDDRSGKQSRRIRCETGNERIDCSDFWQFHVAVYLHCYDHKKVIP